MNGNAEAATVSRSPEAAADRCANLRGGGGIFVARSDSAYMASQRGKSGPIGLALVTQLSLRECQRCCSGSPAGSSPGGERAKEERANAEAAAGLVAAAVATAVAAAAGREAEEVEEQTAAALAAAAAVAAAPRERRPLSPLVASQEAPGGSPM